MAASVVDDRNVSPLIEGNLLTSLNLYRISRPEMDQRKLRVPVIEDQRIPSERRIFGCDALMQDRDTRLVFGRF